MAAICGSLILSFMSNWKPSEQYQKVAEANRVFYAQNAAIYDSSETCVTDQEGQKILERDIDRVLEATGKQPSQIRALDACGGSGNISLKLLRRGVNVTLADISSELQGIFEKKCAEHGYEPTVVCSEIGRFIASGSEPFDLIVFSSALHHLENIDEVLTMAHRRLSPGGVLWSIFDPTANANKSVATRFVVRVEYFCFKLFCQTSDVPGAFIRKLKRFLSGAKASDKSKVDLDESTAGVLAEYHIEQGIDDLALVERMKMVGYDVVFHDRLVGTRYGPTAVVIRLMGDVTTFKLLLRRR